MGGCHRFVSLSLDRKGPVKIDPKRKQHVTSDYILFFVLFINGKDQDHDLYECEAQDKRKG